MDADVEQADSWRDPTQDTRPCLAGRLSIELQPGHPPDWSETASSGARVSLTQRRHRPHQQASQDQESRAATTFGARPGAAQATRHDATRLAVWYVSAALLLVP